MHRRLCFSLIVVIVAVSTFVGGGTAAASSPGQGIVSRPVQASGTIYVVRAGDTLGRIAARYGTTVQALMNANGIRNANFVYVGQRLVIPGGSSAVSPPAAAPTSPTPGTYIVRRGDTLSSIAARYHMTVARLMRANNLTVNAWPFQAAAPAAAPQAAALHPALLSAAAGLMLISAPNA